MKAWILSTILTSISVLTLGFFDSHCIEAPSTCSNQLQYLSTSCKVLPACGHT